VKDARCGPVSSITTEPRLLMNPFTLAQQHIYGFEGQTSEAIFIAGFAALVVVALIVTKMSFRNWLLAATLFATCVAPSVDDAMERFNPTWIFPLQMHHSAIHLGLGVFLTIIAVVSGGMSVRLISIQSILMLLMALYAGLMQFFHEDSSAAIEAIGFAFATIPCFALAAGLSTRGYDACLNVLRMMMWVSVVWTFCCSVQFVINPKYLLSNQGRFFGILGNAQHAAVLVAIMAVIALWLLMHDSRKRTKILWITLLAINLLFLIWTGSRTGGLMFIIGLMSILYARIGKAVLLFPVALLVVWGLAALATALEINANLERFVSLENTRQGVIAGQLTAIVENPLIGVGWRGEAISTENSYLGGFGAYGIIYFLLTVVLLAVSMWKCFRLTTQRRWLAREQRPLIDLFCAFNFMYFAGAMFEGFILARSFAPQFMLLMFAAVGAWLQEEVAFGRARIDEHGEQPDDDAEHMDALPALE
jgi:hypothetical protein